jgi:rapamycin-insensitive companion of mTOR
VAPQENDDALLANLRDSHVLHHDENLDWNWELVQTILKVVQNLR